MEKERIFFYKQFINNLLLLFFLLSGLIFAQNRSKITGTVSDAETGEKLYGVNIILEETNLGAATDLDGVYIIINI